MSDGAYSNPSPEGQGLMNAEPMKKSDLGVRTVSAVVMMTVAGTALWIGGWVWTLFVSLVALGVMWEWWGLTQGIASPGINRVLWALAGIMYVAIASFMLVEFRFGFEGVGMVLLIVGAVICTDIGAYFAGRTIGGPKIAPAISPSKTWSGLIGGMVGASVGIMLIAAVWDASLCAMVYSKEGEFGFDGPCSGYPSLYPHNLLGWGAIAGSLIAITAQAGDFFQSWMKRRAGVKDSGNLLPGHGGLFDRTDGMLAVLFVLALLTFAKALR
jgi:phosphatidate cytidylyltransferase